MNVPEMALLAEYLVDVRRFFDLQLFSNQWGLLTNWPQCRCIAFVCLLARR